MYCKVHDEERIGSHIVVNHTNVLLFAEERIVDQAVGFLGPARQFELLVAKRALATNHFALEHLVNARRVLSRVGHGVPRIYRKVRAFAPLCRGIELLAKALLRDGLHGLLPISSRATSSSH